MFKSDFTKEEWDRAKSLWEKDIPFDEIEKQTGIPALTVKNRCYKKGWLYMPKGSEGRALSSEEKFASRRDRFIDKATEMVDKDIEAIENHKGETITDIKDKYEAANELGKFIKDIYGIGKEEKNPSGVFLIDGRNQFLNLGDNPNESLRELQNMHGDISD